MQVAVYQTSESICTFFIVFFLSRQIPQIRQICQIGQHGQRVKVIGPIRAFRLAALRLRFFGEVHFWPPAVSGYWSDLRFSSCRAPWRRLRR